MEDRCGTGTLHDKVATECERRMDAESQVVDLQAQVLMVRA